MNSDKFQTQKSNYFKRSKFSMRGVRENCVEKTRAKVCSGALAGRALVPHLHVE